MSTPINQLPQQVNPNMVPKLEEDPEVMDVIKGMESEFNQQNNIPQMKPSVPQVQHANMNIQSQQIQQKPVITQIYTNAQESNIKYGIDITIAKRAVVATIVAFVIFYPNDLSELYQKSAYLQKLEPFDKIVRTFIMIAVTYLIFWKLNI